MRLLLVLLLFVLSPKVGLSQNTKNFNIECASLSNQGAVSIIISKNRARANYSPSRAIKDAITAVLMIGLPGSSTCITQAPLLKTVTEQDEFNTLSKDFFSSKGDWSRFGLVVERRDNVSPEGQVEKKREYVISVKKDDLRKYLVENKILQPLTKGF